MSWPNRHVRLGVNSNRLARNIAHGQETHSWLLPCTSALSKAAVAQRAWCSLSSSRLPLRTKRASPLFVLFASANIILLQRIYNSRLPRWLPKRLLFASRHRVFRSRRFPLLLPVAHQLTAHSHSGSPQQNARHAAAVATSSTPHMPPRQATPSTSHTSRAPSPGPSSGTKSASEATLLTTKPLVRPPLHFSPSCSPACSRSLLHR